MRKCLNRNFLTAASFTLLLSGLAIISGSIFEESSAEAQPSSTRAETDSRPSEPAAPTSPTAKTKPGNGKTQSSATSSASTPTSASAVNSATGGAATNAKPTAKTTGKLIAVAKPTPAPTSLETSRKFPKVVTKLMMDDLQSGRGRSTKPGSHLVVHFQSWLYDPTQPLGRGPQFESTHGKAPYKFTLQNPDTPHIRGWEEGLVDMKVGGKRRLIIPPELAYGANGAGQVVPPGATLLYEIELVDVE